ncbi:MAG: hypothetical protein CL679_07315 [Bermanella sp.]|nr:hypothetical protein [Bermanella sp.]
MCILLHIKHSTLFWYKICDWASWFKQKQWADKHLSDYSASFYNQWLYGLVHHQFTQLVMNARA